MVLSGTLNIFIPTSQRAKCAQSCLHEYAHIGAIMPACICTTCYYVCVLTSAILPARACSILDTITSMCVGAHDCDPAHVHNAHVSAIMPTRACTRRHTCVCTHEHNLSLRFVSSIQVNQVNLSTCFCAAAAAGMTSGGPSGKHLLMFQTSVHHVRECLGFTCCRAYSAHSTTWSAQGPA